MNLPYFARLVCLTAACFFLIHLALGIILRSCGPMAIRYAGKLKPRDAAALLLLLRLLPAIVSVLLVAGFCVPSYFRLEPREAAEPVGLVCLAAALFGFWIWAEAITRSVRALSGSRRYIRRCLRSGRAVRIGGAAEPVWVLDDAVAPISLAGLMRPTLVASSVALRALSTEQLEAALKHEQAHWFAHDNLKRLLVTFSPRLFPGVHAFRSMERTWSRFAEWSADDRAAAGDLRQSIVLASTLVRVARLSSAPPPSPVVSSLLADADDLACRVERLLSATRESENPAPGVFLAACGSMALAAAFLLPLTYPAVLRIVHALLELLIQ